MNGFLNSQIKRCKSSDTERILFIDTVQCDGTPLYTAGKFVGSFIAPLSGTYRIKAETNIGGTTTNAGFSFHLITTGRDSLSDEKRIMTLMKLPGVAVGTVIDCTGIGSLPTLLSAGVSYGVNTWGSYTSGDVYIQEGALVSMYIYRSGTTTTAPGPGVRNVKICFDEITITSEGAKV